MPRRRRTHTFVDHNGYPVIVRLGKMARQHRVVWARYRGSIPRGWHVHHVNGIKTDNRIANLEIVTPAEHAGLHREKFRRLADSQNRLPNGRFAVGRKARVETIPWYMRFDNIERSITT